MSFWGERSNALALLELLVDGEVARRQSQEMAWNNLLELGWARRTGRSRVLLLNPEDRGNVRETLSRAWPEWRAVADQLQAKNLPNTPTGLRELERQERIEAADAMGLPARMNRHTAAAMLGRHAKVRLGPFEQVVLEDVEVTDDGIVRMRPSAGLALERDGVVHDAGKLARLLGELVLSDRALRGGTRLAGAPPRAVLTIENLGAFQDATVADDILVVYVPGWNTRIARDLLSGLAGVPILHFGDLDPNGVAILAHLRRWRADVRWLVPAFWAEYLEAKQLSKQWPDIDLPGDVPAWVIRLVSDGLWLEQEVVAVDPRFSQAVEAAIPGPGQLHERC